MTGPIVVFFVIFGSITYLISLLKIHLFPAFLPLALIAASIPILFTIHLKRDLPKVKHLALSISVLIPSFFLVIFSPNIQISFHGAFHSVYFSQILQHKIPPENVTLPGYPANVYWVYHAILAAIYSIFNLPPPMISALFNFLILLFCFIVIYRIICLFKLKHGMATAPIIILFSGNITAFIQVLGHHPYTNNFQRLTTIGDGRLTNLFGKFINFNGFPLGVLFYLCSLYFSFKLYRSIIHGRLNQPSLSLLIASLTASLYFHPTTSIYLGLNILLSIFFTFIFYSHQFKKALQEFRPKPILLLSILVLIPSVVYSLNLSRQLPEKVALSPILPFNILSVISFSLPAVILILFLHRYIPQRLKLFFVTSLFSTILIFFLKLPDGNQYKFVFLNYLNYSLILVITINRLKLYRKATILFFLVSTVNIYFSVIRHYETFNKYPPHCYFKSTVNLCDPQQNQDYLWIRLNTPPNTLLINPIELKDNSPFFLISQRLSFVTSANIYAQNIEEYQTRVDLIDRLYNDGPSLQILSQVKQLIPKSFTSQIYVVPQQIDQKFFMENLDLVYQGNLYNYYQ